MTVYLLDVNLLLALIDPVHIHHDVAHRWFVADGGQAWATCPITENGCVRIISHPRYPSRLDDVRSALALLDVLCQADGHHFWSDDISVRNLLEPERVITHAHITDVFLLGLAVHHGGKLATFDRRIPSGAIDGGVDALEVIPH